MAADIVAALGLTFADLFDDSTNRRHAKPDPFVSRRRRAAEGLESWRQAELRRVAEELRTRDMIVRQIDGPVHDGLFTEDEVLTSLAYEFRGYGELEHRFDRLLRNEDTLQLWRESGAV